MSVRSQNFKEMWQYFTCEVLGLKLSAKDSPFSLGLGFKVIGLCKPSKRIGFCVLDSRSKYSKLGFRVSGLGIKVF